jgi:hypothetical protein
MKQRSRYLHLKKAIAVFLLGCLLGSVTIAYLSVVKLEPLREQNVQLKNEVTELEDTIEKLQQNAKSYREKIAKITIHVMDAPDGFAETKITELVKADLAYLVDQPIEKVVTLSPMIRSALNRKVYQINERRFMVIVDLMTISNESHFWIRLRRPMD